MKPRGSRGRREPSARDLAIWKQAQHDLMDWQYTGLVGALEAAGHRVVGEWLEPHAAGAVLEIGCGHGHHLIYSGVKPRNYIGLDWTLPFLKTLQNRLPGTALINGDAYALPLREQSIDCVISMYCFEHLDKLPECLVEIRRVLKPGGSLLVGLPAEGGLLYEIGRMFTTKRYIERKYGFDYDAVVKWEHCNTAHEVARELSAHFEIRDHRFLPFRLPSVHLSAIVCYECVGRESAGR